MNNIITPFFTNILIKDYEKSEQWNCELINTLKALSLNGEYCDLRKDLKNNKNTFLLTYDYHKLSKPYVITEETSSMFPIIKELRDMYIDCFYELASSFKNNILTKDEIKKIFFSDSGNFTELKKNMVVGLHNHPSRAFAIFYLSDVDNSQYGGELILHDPAFHANKRFHPKQKIKIKTKKNRMIIGPSYIWHEVSKFYGKDRFCAVVDLDRK